jgi:proline iminopeptidase
MATAEMNGTQIWYEQLGNGPVRLMMHGGLGFDHTYFRPGFDVLADGHQVVYYDHRGNGRSGRPPLETVSIEQLADDAAGLLDHLGVERATLIGHSYGGFVAQEFALRHPGRLGGLVLIDTTPGQLGDGESADDQGPPPPAEFLELTSVPPATDEDFAAMGTKVLPFYFHHPENVDIEGQFADTIFTASTMVHSMTIINAWSVTDRLRDITAPTLMLCGRHDIVTSFPQAERIAARIPGADLEIFEHSGHFPWLEEPDAFFDTLGTWLASGTGV